MEIRVNDASREFFLSNKYISYACGVLPNGELMHFYFGKRISYRDSFLHLLDTRALLPSSPKCEATELYPDLLPYEYPVYGKGDYREPAIVLRGEDGSRISDFVYHSYRVIEGKPPLSSLPSSWVADTADALTLEIDLFDALRNCCLTLRYSIFSSYALIVRSASITNRGDTLVIERMLSTSIDYNDAEWEALYLTGHWGREAQLTVQKLQQGRFVLDSKRGTSSSVINPFLALKRPHTDEAQGEVVGFNFIYSGNFIAQAEVSGHRMLRVGMGLNPFDFSWLLNTGESFHTPEVVSVYSHTGLAAMSHTFHRFYRNQLIHERSHPVLLNSWEAMYFSFDEKKLCEVAASAEELGVELFVLDDGWFGKRDDDTTSLGDWYADARKLPSGIKALADSIKKKGMRFGIWLEPEMVSKDSDLYRAHPKWLLQVPERRLTPARNQYVLDLSNEEVVQHLFSVLHSLLKDSGISYVKWDMNRSMTEVGSAVLPPERQKEVAHRYMLGLYRLLDQLLRSFPDILFESCASGGNRFDPGMMYYMPQAWASDTTDARSRISTQYGLSYVYPLSVIGAHVSTVPNHQTGRSTSLTFRGDVSLFGAHGYELDPRALSAQERNEVASQIARYKELRNLIHEGRFFRLQSPQDNTTAAWMVVNQDATEALVGWYVLLVEANTPALRIKLAGLIPDCAYSVHARGEYKEWEEKTPAQKVMDLTRPQHYSGEELMKIGYGISYPSGPLGDFLSLVLEVKMQTEKSG